MGAHTHTRQAYWMKRRGDRVNNYSDPSPIVILRITGVMHSSITSRVHCPFLRQLLLCTSVWDLLHTRLFLRWEKDAVSGSRWGKSVIRQKHLPIRERKKEEEDEIKYFSFHLLPIRQQQASTTRKQQQSQSLCRKPVLHLLNHELVSRPSLCLFPRFRCLLFTFFCLEKWQAINLSSFWFLAESLLSSAKIRGREREREKTFNSFPHFVMLENGLF